ncbi:EAL domain-containing protein [Thalassolituus sp.]|uniref:sensor domain-containing protein n=1 Tax=Thalassolituus sp. TaxID=2030822 RepID=UPI003515181E
MLPQQGVTADSGSRPLSPGKANLALFVLSFLFLAVVLGFNSWQAWQDNRVVYNNEVHRTLETYSMQAGLIVRAGLHANQMFTRSYGDLLVRYAETPRQVDEARLWEHVSTAIFNATGFFVYTSDGDFIRSFGPQLSDRELTDISDNLVSSGLDRSVFSLRYGHQGGYYVGTRFSTPTGHYILVTRRAYSHLSDIIYRGNFPGFEMILIDRRDDRVFIREQYYADSGKQPQLQADEKQALIYRASINDSFWDVVAVPLKNYHRDQLISAVQSPAIFLLVFGLMLLALYRFLRHQDVAVEKLNQERIDTQRRADRVLRSIDEALISTDAMGLVTYVNPKALTLLGRRDPESVLGESLCKLWPDHQALWNRGMDTRSLENPTPAERLLRLSTAAEDRILEQNVHVLYDNHRVNGHVWLLRDISATLKANAALDESRSRYKALFEEAGIAHCMLDLSSFDGSMESLRLISVNDATLHLADFASTEAMLAHYGKHSKALQPFLDALQTACELQLNSNECEIRLPNRSGEMRDIWMNISFRSGSSRQVLMTMLDVTERKHATQQIVEREAFWNHVMNAMPDVIYVLDLDENMHQKSIFFNRHICTLLGYEDSPENVGKPWLDYVIDQDLGKCRRGLENIRNAKAGSTIEASARFRHVDGSIRILRFRDTPFVFDEKGKVKRYIGTARDVTEDIEKQEQIVESERRYRLLAENISDIIWATDAELNFNFVSTSVARILGYQPDELIREGIAVVFGQTELRKLFRSMQTHIQLALRSPESARRRSSVIRQDMMARSRAGTDVLLELQASLLWNDHGELQGMLGICRDVTESRGIEKELQLAAEVFESSNEAILITDQQLHIANTNRAFTHITGYEHNDVIGKTPDILISSEQLENDFFEYVGETLVLDGYWQGEISYRRKNGDLRTGWAGVSAIRDQNQEVQSLIIIMSDITERKATEERIHKLAYYDPLTNLPNRSQMHETLERMLERARDHGRWVALLFIDLDRFKPINDSMGHPAGDDVLQQVAGRLRNCVKQRDLVCRMGGDEFTIAIADQLSHKAAEDTSVIIAERILEALHQPFSLNQREVFISASIGIAIFPNDGGSVTELLKNADMAMYHAKDMGRDNLQFFTSSMNRKAVQLLELENDLRHALARDEMELFFQPQYQASSGGMVGAEALLRWNHPTRGMLSPGLFVPIIEDTGLIVPIGQWVLEEACRKFMEWREQGIALQRIAVNVSARQFRNDDFLSVVKDIIFRTGIRPEQLELELTESILMEDVESAMEVLQGLRTMGVRTAIDDFGTGYSSLNYLKQFPVDTLKIDRSFIQNLPENADDAQISRTIIAMGHNLGMGIIAEGVETADQLAFLQAASCEEVQGFYFSRPVAESDFIGLIKSVI